MTAEPEATTPEAKKEEPDPAKIPTLSEDQARWLSLWMKGEDVAMHFNDLILNFRLKALGALGVGAGVIGSILVTKDEVELRLRLAALAATLLFFGVLWLAAWLLDVRYYQRLLVGAVNEIRRLEKLSGGNVALSNAIRDEVNAADLKVVGRAGRHLFYIIPFAAVLASAAILLGLVFWADFPTHSTATTSVDAGVEAASTQVSPCPTIMIAPCPAITPSAMTTADATAD